jgi:hypothetical protein
VEDWLVTDERAELIAKIRRMAREKFSVQPRAGSAVLDDLRIDAEPVVHTSRVTYGYGIQLGNSMAVWAPEFLEFPRWAASAKIMFVDAAGCIPYSICQARWRTCCGARRCEAAQARNVARLVFAHVGNRRSVRWMPASRFRSESSVRRKPRTS